MADKKEIAKLVRKAEGWPGWRVDPTTKGWWLIPPDRTMPKVLIHRTPSDPRSWANTIAQLRRSGAPI